MTPDIRKERETALYEAALRLIAKGVNPAAMKVQQIADEAGIGKGTVYEYFASKDEILQGMALYCFDTEIARIAVLMEPCTTLQELEDAVMAYLQDLSGNRMGTYQVIASSIGARENLRGMDECVQALRGVLHRTMAALRQKGEINPALPDDFVLTQDSTYDAIFTLYRSYEDGRQYVVVVNKNFKPNGKRTFSLHAAADLTSLEVYRDGKWETVSMQDGKFTEVIAAGDFALFRLPEGYDAAQKTAQSENLALNCPVYASTSSYDFWSASENAAYMLTDGVTDRDGYMAANSNFYRESPVLTLDLGSVRNFSRINLYGLPGNAKKTAKNIRIAYSVDGVNWTELSDVSEVGDKKEITFDAIDARYVRLTLGTKRAGLGEIEVYEK